MQRRKVDDKNSDGDVESQTTSPISAPRIRPAGAVSTGSGASNTVGGGGANRALLILRKIMMIGEEDIGSSQNYLLTIIKDVISGTILGVFFLMILIFLDYRNIVQLGSARAFRRAAFELMTDPETVKTIEENIEIKFIPVEVFSSMKDEIHRNQQKVADGTGLKQHEEDLASRTKELEGMRKDYEEWKEKGNSVLHLDKWCDGCKGGWGNCGQRIKYLMDTYHTPEIKAKVDIMSSGKCKK